MNAINLLVLLGLLLPFTFVFAASDAAVNISEEFAWIAVLLLLAKFSSLIEKWKQASVLGELLLGVLLGNLVWLGIPWFEPLRDNHIFHFIAELGVVILLFQVGLETHLKDLLSRGREALQVALIGILVPFILGAYVIGPWLLPGLPTVAYLFLGAALTATSVGITARVFQDLKQNHTDEAQIVLGAAVVDDILGLLLLAVVVAIATTGAVDSTAVSLIIVKAIVFLSAALLIGRYLAVHISHALSKVNSQVGMKFSIVIGFCLLFSYVATLFGLEPLVGAFAAGLILEQVYFEGYTYGNRDIQQDMRKALQETTLPNMDKQHLLAILDKHKKHSLEMLVMPLWHFTVPIFFIAIGMQVNLSVLFDFSVIGIALLITLVAFAGKLVSAYGASSVKNKWIVGWGMVPRGEVGLIFATIGKEAGAISEQVFSIIIVVVILTTLLTPPVLTYLLSKRASEVVSE